VHAQDALVKIAKKLKKNNVAVDVVSFGSEEANGGKLEAFHAAVNSNGNSHLVNVPPGTILSDQLFGTPIFMEEGADGGGGGGGEGAPAAPRSECPAVGRAWLALLRFACVCGVRAQLPRGGLPAVQSARLSAPSAPGFGPIDRPTGFAQCRPSSALHAARPPCLIHLLTVSVPDVPTRQCGGWV
jgi:hypothetical protein